MPQDEGIDEKQQAFWQRFWSGSGSVHVDRKSLARKLSKQGGHVLRNTDLRGKKLLDVGCGFGFIDHYLVQQTDVSITGMDFQAHLIKNIVGVNRVSGDACSLPFQSGAFDAVLTVETLHHIKRPQRGRVLDEMCRVLKPGGDLYVIEVNRFHPLIMALTIFDSSERHQATMSIRHLSSIIRDRFATIAIHPLNFFLPTYKYNPPPLVETLRGAIVS